MGVNGEVLQLHAHVHYTCKVSNLTCLVKLQTLLVQLIAIVLQAMVLHIQTQKLFDKPFKEGEE